MTQFPDRRSDRTLAMSRDLMDKIVAGKELDLSVLMGVPFQFSNTEYVKARLFEDLDRIDARCPGPRDERVNVERGSKYLDVTSDEFDPVLLLRRPDLAYVPLLAKPFKDIRMYEFKTFPNRHTAAAKDASQAEAL